MTVRSTVALADVVEHVAWEFHVSATAISGGTGRHYVAQARYAVVWLARRHLPLTPPRIAEALGWRPEYGAVFHRRATLLIAASADWRALFTRLDSMLAAI